MTQRPELIRLSAHRRKPVDECTPADFEQAMRYAIANMRRITEAISSRRGDHA